MRRRCQLSYSGAYGNQIQQIISMWQPKAYQKGGSGCQLAYPGAYGNQIQQIISMWQPEAHHKRGSGCHDRK